jgi:3'(2'), 5'-bisphosphate nucleotidase
MNDRMLLELAFDLARRAGDVILEIRKRGFETMCKSDSSPVTEADHAAEALIVAALREATPDIPVVAEEEIAGGHDPCCREAFWMVDPLDGTREFAAGGEDFVVCIGLVRGLRPVLGVIGHPISGDLFGGIVGVGAWKRDANGERPITARAVPGEGMTVLGSRRHGDDAKLNRHLDGHAVANVETMGSALKFCRVAEGVADMYPRLGPTMEWDTAAGQALLEAAGGSVRVIGTDEVLGYGKPDWRNPDFICTGRP